MRTLLVFLAAVFAFLVSMAAVKNFLNQTNKAVQASVQKAQERR
jgi:hypothetical protein